MVEASLHPESSCGVILKGLQAVKDLARDGRKPTFEETP